MTTEAVLLIDCALTGCRVSLGNAGGCLWEMEENREHAAAETIAPFAAKAVAFARQNDMVLKAIAIVAGPGSYTGIRIGMAFARGLAYGLNLQVLPLNKLQLMAAQAASALQLEEKTVVLAAIDARRDEVYMGAWQADGQLAMKPQAYILKEDAEKDLPRQRPLVVVGNASRKIQSFVGSEGILYFDGQQAGHVAERMAWQQYLDGRAESPFDTQPIYLKEVHITTKKN